jgi:hypothetical protein
MRGGMRYPLMPADINDMGILKQSEGILKQSGVSV